jgi:hypothetical protein
MRAAAETRDSEVVILLIRAMRLHNSEKRRDEKKVARFDPELRDRGILTAGLSYSVWLGFPDALSCLRHLHEFAGKFSGVRHSVSVVP